MSAPQTLCFFLLKTIELTGTSLFRDVSAILKCSVLFSLSTKSKHRGLCSPLGLWVTLAYLTPRPLAYTVTQQYRAGDVLQAGAAQTARYPMLSCWESSAAHLFAHCV